MNHLTLEQQTLLALLRHSLWGEQLKIPGNVNWEQVDTIAREQGVISFAYDGAIKAKADVPDEILQKWKNRMIRGVLNNERLMNAQDQILRWFSEAGIPTVVLKGSSVARYYPQPDLRVLGDIDILVKREDLNQAQSILEQHGYTMYEDDPGYHICFGRSGISVELHYDVTALPDSAGGRRMGRVTAQFMSDISCGGIGQRQFPTLSESNQAIALLLHMIRHMFGSHIGLRQLCDWAMYMADTDMDVFSNQTLSALAYGGILYYAKVATRTSVKFLGLSETMAGWCSDIEDEESRIFISDIFHGGNMGAADKEGLGSLFTNSKAMGTKESSLTALLIRLTQRCYQLYPFTKKYKVLLPVFWLFLPIRYFIYSVMGLRPKKSILRVVQSAQQRRKLYEMLNLFQSEK